MGVAQIASPEEGSLSTGSSSSTILVVDDNPVNRKILAHHLEQEGHAVRAAENGRQALDALHSQPFDLVILDIMMPEMNGFEVLRRMKAEASLRAIPVIVISALEDMNSLVRCIELGADDYLPRMFNPTLLRARVEASLEKKRLRDQEQAYLLAAKRQTEEALLESQAHLQAVVSSAPVVLFSLDARGVVTLAEGKGLEKAGLKAGDLLGRPAAEIFPGNDSFQANLRRAMAGESGVDEVEIGKTVWEARYGPVHGDQGDFVGVIGVAIDITERRRAEEERERLFKEVSESRERLRALSQRLVEIQEDERVHIAHELHDEIGQSLTGLKLALEMGLRALDGADTPHLKEAQSLTNELMSRVREMSLNLRPAMLDDLGVLPALLWHFERFAAQTNINVISEYYDMERRFSPQIETAVYRITQEALTNVARHAGVDEVKVRLRADEGSVCVEVEDRGGGFDVRAALASNDSSGLAGMYERAHLMGGRMAIESSPGSGTLLRAELPLSVEDAAGGEGGEA